LAFFVAALGRPLCRTRRQPSRPPVRHCRSAHESAYHEPRDTPGLARGRIDLAAIEQTRDPIASVIIGNVFAIWDVCARTPAQ
jgi:hypothetical protein